MNTLADVSYEIMQRWGGYAPHGICLLYEPAILAVKVLTGLLTAMAYFAIPFVLWHFVRRFKTLPFRSIGIMFLTFICACGASHVTGVLTLFLGGSFYWLDAAIGVVMTVASLGTATGVMIYRKRIAFTAARLLAAA